jgi:hypothetical protein
MRKLLATLAALAIANLGLCAPAQAQIPNGPPSEDKLTPEIVAAQPRLEQRDVSLFVDFFQGILSGTTPPSSTLAFATIHGVSVKRLNLISVKLSFPFIPEDSKKALLKELGVGILLNGDEKGLIEKNMGELGPIMDFFKAGGGG